MYARLRFVLAALTVVATAHASGPRFVAGPPFFTAPPGRPIGWKQTTLLYSTDPGALGPAVNHAAADALVAAAAGVWNVPVASISVAQGAPLAEHVSGQNVYLSTSGLVWPDDVESTNDTAVPLAVVYDADGSVTDTLLGSGASDPGGCQQNAVTETVDRFDPAGYILHAIIVVNGRCTGALPQQQLQLQYQLERTFGRVLGLAWSQVNDNVFTGNPTPNIDQARHWPIMHPFDILCGTYSYQCLPDPFTLRPDDIAGLVGLYPIPNGATPPPGKVGSYVGANGRDGWVRFPTGEGMAGVNLVCRRAPRYQTYVQDWEETSAVTGAGFRRAGTSPFVAAGIDAASSFGSLRPEDQQAYFVPYFEILDPFGVQGEQLTLQPINPLYFGSASLGPYAAGVAAPAGTPTTDGTVEGPLYIEETDFTVHDAPATCGNGLDGAASLPVAVAASGWWNGVLCGYGHASYVAAAIKPGRSLTVEVTALDDNGFATTTKAMPVIGLFQASDAPGALPSVGVAPAAFQGLGLGTTVLAAEPFAPGTAGGSITIGIADQRGDGRPDFLYQARLFYADQIVPAAIATGGGRAVVAGTGFRVGNAVSVNGVAASVVSWTSTSIVVDVPSLTQAGAVAGIPVDVTVHDAGTGATGTITGGLTYTPVTVAADVIHLVTAPAGPIFVGDTAPVPFAVAVTTLDGSQPVAGQPVLFSAQNGAALFTACGKAATCSVLSDANGQASTTVSPQAAGNVTIQAALGKSTVSASFEATPLPNKMTVQSTPSDPSTVGVAAGGQFQVQVVAANGSGLQGQLVTFSVTQGSATFGQCNASPCSMTTNRYGQAWMVVTATSPGPVTIVATDESLSQSITLHGILDVPQLKVLSAIDATGFVQGDLGKLIVRLVHGDGVTPFWDVPVELTAPAGIDWDACGGPTCSVPTDHTGVISSNPHASAPGTYVLSASALGLSVSFTVAVAVRATTLTVLSAPSGSLPAGIKTTVPFSVRLLDGFGNPLGAREITFGGVEELVRFDCNHATCNYFTDGNGVVSTTVTPLRPGRIDLNATFVTLVAAVSFTATGQPISFNVLRAPPAIVTVGDQLTFEYQTLGTDGITPLTYQYVVFYNEVGTLTLDRCPFGSCYTATDQVGLLTVTATPTVPGPVTLVALCDGFTRPISFNVLPLAATMKVLSAPRGDALAGQRLAAPFTVQVVRADGKTPVPGQNVAFTVAAGSASLSACPQAVCVVTTDTSGMASTAVTAGQKPGPVTLTAVNNAFSASESFQVLAPDLVTLATAPATVFQGATAPLPLAVKVTAADGVSPVPGVAVVFATNGSGRAIFTACGRQTCTLATDGAGIASTTIAGVLPGVLTLTATAQLAAGNQAVSAAFAVLANLRTVIPAEPQIYVAEGASVTYTEHATAIQNATPAAGTAIVWSGGKGLVLTPATSIADADGKSASQATAGPLAGKVAIAGSVCAWTTVCGVFSATGVPAADQWIAAVSGGRQAVSGGALLQPVSLLVTDAAGHPVAGATVSIGQTVYAQSSPCPAESRCPAAPVIANGTSVATANLDGSIAVQPLAQAGIATRTAMAFSVGTQGFATVEVFSTP